MASDSFATLMEWNNIDYLPKSRRVYQASFPVKICAIQYMMKKIEALLRILLRQIEYYVDIASDFGSDFAVFSELFTTQLMSFLEGKTTRPGCSSSSDLYRYDILNCLQNLLSAIMLTS